MNIRFPDTYTDAKEVLDDILANERLGLKRYGALLTNVCIVTHYEISPVYSDDGLNDYANLDLTISYNENILVEESGFTVIPRTQTLRLYSTIGDKLWNHVMISKLWNGNYPSTIAINHLTGVVYLVNINGAALELVYFGELSKNELELFDMEWFEREPFALKLDEDAMFDYISEAEGTNYLKKKIFIELHTSTIKIRVYPKEKSVI